MEQILAVMSERQMQYERDTFDPQKVLKDAGGESAVQGTRSRAEEIRSPQTEAAVAGVRRDGHRTQGARRRG